MLFLSSCRPSLQSDMPQPYNEGVELRCGEASVSLSMLLVSRPASCWVCVFY